MRMSFLKMHAAVQIIGRGRVMADRRMRLDLPEASCHHDVLCVEDITQTGNYLWSDLSKLSHEGLQFILLGGSRQFPLTCDTWSCSTFPV